jgi:hypothetical protein
MAMAIIPRLVLGRVSFPFADVLLPVFVPAWSGMLTAGSRL